MTIRTVRRLVASAAALAILALLAVSFRPPDDVYIAMPPDPVRHPAAVADAPVAPMPSPAPSVQSQPTASSSPPPEASAERAKEEPKPEEAKPAKPAKPQPIDTPKRSLYLAIGHGKTPGGKLQVGSINPRTGHKEIDAAAVIVEAMVEVLERAPNLTLWAESGRDHPNLIGSVLAANRLGADDCIEIHQDWHKAPRGAFAHWYPSAHSARDLANRLVRGLRDEGIETRDRWHKPRPGLHFLRETKCRAVLVEVGRVGDFTKKELREYGRALAVAYIKDIREQG